MDAIRDSKSKSATTRAAIIEHALGVASQGGLEALTLGTLAESMKMSKSGVFSRVGSRETLQLAVLANYRQRFEAQVLQPSQRIAPGLPRLRRLFDMSLKQVESGRATNSAGCFYSAAQPSTTTGPARYAMRSPTASMPGAMRSKKARARRCC